MRTAHLDEIIRQKDPALKQAVEQLAGGEVRAAVQNLSQQGRVHEIVDRQERMEAIAKAYAEHPERTLVVSPDNKSRQEINALIHRELQSRNKVQEQERRLAILVPRQEMTGADRQWAAQYEAGDIVRYTRGSQALSIQAGEYVRVASVDRERNLLTVERANGEQVTYDPRRLHGVSKRVSECSSRRPTGMDISPTANSGPWRESTRREIFRSGWTRDGTCS
jgi:hypothetical protein